MLSLRKNCQTQLKMKSVLGPEIILNLSLVLAVCFMNSCVRAETYSDEKILQRCEKFLETNPRSRNLNIYFWNNADMGSFSELDGNYQLNSYIKFHQISSVKEGNDVTSVCVSVEDTTSYSYLRDRLSDGPAAYVTFNTRIEIPTSVINVSTSCWRKSKRLNECQPVFLPMPGFMESALYNYSPLNEEFWNHVQDDTLFNTNWVWRMNFKSNIGNINSSWVPRLNISNITELQFLGNDWRRPDSLIGSLPKLVALDLSYNNIEILPNDTLERMPELRKINMGHNNISKLPYGVDKLHQIRIVDLTNPTGNATLSLSDEEIQTLSKVQILGLERTKLEANVSTILDLPNLVFLNMSGCFLGKIEDDFDTKPSHQSKLINLDLSFNNLTELPKTTFSRMVSLRNLHLHDNFIDVCSDGALRSLTSLVYLDLSRNRFKTLDPECFSELRYLKELDISWNNLNVIGPFAFNNVSTLERLDLSHNMISFINQESFLPLHNLKILDLSFNQLKENPSLNSPQIDRLILTHNLLARYVNITSSPKHIKYLDLSENHIQELHFQNVAELNLSYNSLTHVPTHMWKYLQSPSIVTVDLGGNNFNCCHNDTKYLQGIVNSSRRIRNLYDGKLFTCSLDHDQEVLLATFQYNSSICLESDLSSNNRRIEIEIGVAIIFLTALAALTAALLYFYRTELTYISHLFKMKKRGWERDEERYNVCHYDAFVCYSGKDFKWVMQQLLPNLESESAGYRLCVHDRDFTLGAAIDTNVVASLEKSRKVIFILTQEFIGSKWCQWELEMANHKMFEENRGYIILIELERLDKKNMPRHLRYLMDTRTYLEWPQDTSDEQKVLRCWKRLRNALGDSILKRTGRGAPRCSVLDLCQDL